MAQKILIVDDDPMLRKMYSKKFEIAGFEVEMARNGEECLEKVRSFKPNLILSDVMMPKIDGLDFLKQIKADADLSSIPVVLVTNVGAAEEDKKRGIELGASDYLIKSQHSPTEIIETAKKYIK
jgi:DNA-binding response OmpR family regulator